MTKKEALRKLQFGGYDKMLAFCHKNQLMDVKLDLSIWLNKLPENYQIEDKNILNFIRNLNKKEQYDNIRKQQRRGLIDINLKQKVFYEDNDFFSNKNKDQNKGLSEDDIQDLLSSCIKEFYKEKKEQHQKVLFLHIMRKYTHQEIADELGMSRGEVKHLILTFKKNGLYDTIRLRIQEVVHD